MEKLKIEDSNVAFLGSDLEHQCRKECSQNEPAWENAGTAPGLEIWRIEKFKVVAWPKEEYGHFFIGDTYIVLKTFKVENQLEFTAHLWVGKETTQDEAGVGAYKIVELDAHLNDKATLVYEPQDFESKLFLSYFPVLNKMQGGIESGFKKVPKGQYKPRLLHVRGEGKNVQSTEVPLSYKSLNRGDVFVLDLGEKIFNWRGSKSSSFEKFHGAALIKQLSEERGGHVEAVDIEETDDNENSKEFYSKLADGNQNDIKDEKKMYSDNTKFCVKIMKRISDANGNISMTDVVYDKKNLDSNDVFLVDRGDFIFIWIGNGASKQEKRMGFAFGQKYIKEYNRPSRIPMVNILESNMGKMTDLFNECFL